MRNWIEQESKRKYHSVSMLFPMLQGKDFEKLKQDIKENGLLEPIWLHQDGSIIDGRNRHRACIETGIQPAFRLWNGNGSLVSFVVSINLHRRHLTSSQRSVIALDVMPMLESEAKERQGRRNDIKEKIPESQSRQARDDAATMFQTNARYIQDAKALQQESPELLEQVRQGEKSIPEAKKELRKQQRDSQRQVLAQQALDIKPDNRYHIQQADIRIYQTSKQYDFIITDPPYPKEYLELYEVLAKRTLEWLKPSGLLVVMCGQSYLSQIVHMLDKYLEYYWSGCYYTPGQPKPLRQRQVNTTWKPILMYNIPGQKYKGKIFGDVWTSDRNEKEYHDWGQSISGMYSLISQVCLPGQTIFDPFIGAGTTGIAALKHGCLFEGIDIEQEKVSISITRLQEICLD